MALSLLMAAPASAATYNFTMGTSSGTFDAPLGGGLITSFSVQLSNTVFDTLAVGAAAPVYNPVINTLNNMLDVEFTGAGMSSGFVYNSVGTAECPLGQCVLELFDTGNGGGFIPEYLVFNSVTLQNIALGVYSIDPDPVGAAVPLPAGMGLLALGLAALGFTARRKTA